MQVGDVVQFDPEMEGTIREVVTSGTVTDPLLGDGFDASADDPVLMLDTADGPVAVYASEAKNIRPAATDGWATLVQMLADHETAVEEKGLEPWARPDGRAVKTVFERGMKSWPGEQATMLTREEWGLGRAEAFLALAGGVPVGGYIRDADLLPEGHPLRA